MLVTAVALQILSLLKIQLKDGGKTALPVDTNSIQDLIVVERSRDSFSEYTYGCCIHITL